MGVAATVALVAVLGVSAAPAPEPLTFEGAIELPHVEGRIDHMAFDAAAQRLFVAALGNDTVEVVDVRSRTDIKSLPGFREPQGIAVVAASREVGVANGEGEGLQLLDAGDYHGIGTIPLGEDSDNVRYDAAAKRVYVGFGSGALAAIDADSRKVLGEARLADHPESFQIERTGSLIYVNVPATDQIAVVDRSTMKVVRTWPVAAAGANFPMALDEANHRLFIGCRRPATVRVYDTSTGKATSFFETVADTDDLFYDAARHRLYVSGGEGYVDVFQQNSGGFDRISHVATAPGARTSLFVAAESRLYVAVPHRANQRAEIRIYAVR